MHLLTQLALLPFALSGAVLLLLASLIVAARVVESDQSRHNDPDVRPASLAAEGFGGHPKSGHSNRSIVSLRGDLSARITKATAPSTQSQHGG